MSGAFFMVFQGGVKKYMNEKSGVTLFNYDKYSYYFNQTG